MSNTSKASTPTKAGETTVQTKPHVSYELCVTEAVTRIDAMLRGGAEAVTYISSALLIGYLAQRDGASKGVKLSVIKDEFSLLLKKRGLGATQTSKYLDYASQLAAEMFKECQFGMEVAALIAADTADKAHAAVRAWLARHTIGKKSEHGYNFSEASNKLNVLAIFLKKEPDPAKPDPLTVPVTAAEKQKAEDKARKALADKIGKDPAVLNSVNADRLIETVSKVATFDVLVSKHVLTVPTADELEREFAAISKAYQDRIAQLRAVLGKRSKPKAAKAKASRNKPGRATDDVSKEAAAA